MYCLFSLFSFTFPSTKRKLNNQTIKNEIARLTDEFNSSYWGATEQKSRFKTAEELEK